MASCIDPHDAPAVYSVGKDDRARFFLRTANRLWDSGEAVAAGMCARTAIELHLGSLCMNAPRVANPKRPASIDACAMHLFAAGVIDRQTSKKLKRLNDAACAAVHGSFVSYAKLGELLRMAAVVVNWWPGDCESFAVEPQVVV